jgi:carbonic anhydrase
MSVFTIGSLVLAGAAFGAEEHRQRGRWGYSGDHGPHRWAELKPEFSDCAGRNQSPVDLSGMIEAELESLSFDYREGGHEVINNGHTIQVNYEAGSSVSIDGRRFELKQFHFHAPSENRIDGKSFPLEAHLVHADKDGNLAVVAVMLDEGKANPVVGDAWAQMPKAEGGRNALPAGVTAAGLLPADLDYYRYNGSLTTPPCTEGVRWIVMKNPMTVSKPQLEAFATALGVANNRPLQPANARPILK